MELSDYQYEALATSQWAQKREKAVLIGLLGLSGEVGSLLTEYKKRLRDGEGHQAYKDRMAEELGDVLWYVAEVASCLGLDLSEVAVSNLQKVRDRWGDPAATDAPFLFATDFYDDTFPEDQRIPRRFRIRIEELDGTSPPRILLSRRGKPCGNELTDNSYDDDGYRFHDAFHLAYETILRWSPVTRKLLGCKRRSQPKIDEVQDGGRAIVIEEGIAAFVFDYARRHRFFDGVNHVDTGVLRTIKSLVTGLEVASRSTKDWERAILSGFHIWRQVRRNGGGFVACDLVERRIRYRRIPTRRAAADGTPNPNAGHLGG